MLLTIWYIILLLNFIFCTVCAVIDPLSLAAGAAALVGTAYYTGVCYLSECCHEKAIPGDFAKLQSLLNNKLYGQHIAKGVVVNALRSHWDNNRRQKALTLSFHGVPGSGKNYFTKFIAESIYKEGTKSRFVHHFMGRIHFPLVEKVHQYQANLYQWIKGNVTNCGRQLFIFDEVDKMPPKVLDVIKPLIDYNNAVERIDYRDCIFIFLSNTGSTAIISEYLKFWQGGTKREDIRLKHFERLISQGAFNEEGGFYRSDTIKSNLIDHYIPFLPMELEHVRKCILDEFIIRGVDNPTDQQMQEVLEYIEWGPPPENLFSKTGCKRLSQKVAVVAW